MATIRNLQRSFSGGEVSPEMFGRIDDAKYQSGLALCRNFIPKPQGPAENRAGFRYVNAMKDSTKKVRLIPFTYSTTQTMVIEMGAGYFRFHTLGATVLSGGVPYEVTNPYAESDLFDMHFVQSADVLTLVHQKHPPMELRRYGPTNWTLSAVDFIPDIAPPASVTAVAAGYTSAKYEYQYAVTSIAVDGVSESTPSAAVKVMGNLYETGSTNKISWVRSASASRYNVYKLQGGVWGYIGNTTAGSIVDDNIAPDLSKTPPNHEDPFAPNGIKAVEVLNGGVGYGSITKGGKITSVLVAQQGSGYGSAVSIAAADSAGSGASLSLTRSGSGAITSVSVVSQGSGYTNPQFTLSDNGIQVAQGEGTVTGYGSGARFFADVEPISSTPELTITDPTGSGAVLEPVLGAGGAIVSIRVIQPGKNYTSPTVSISWAAGGTGAQIGAVSLTDSNYPGAVSYFEQRRCFGGTTRQPQNIWMTKSGTESNMSYALPIKDDDRIAFRVASREANTIRHIVPLTQLLLLTSSAEWRVTSVNSDAVTPNTISVKPQSYVGASNVQPVTINNTCLYGAASGGHVRELSYSWQANGFATGDLSLRATHLFDTFDIVDMAYAKAPLPIVWFVSTSGKLLGLTYVPEQQIGAWHQHDTDGVFESCTVVAEGGEDALYCVIRRTINGVSRRYIERLSSRQFTNQADAFFVDCGATYSGAPASVIGGLGHLEGKVVSILADGAVHPQRTVTGGSVTLDIEASVVHVGLPITADLQTLPVAAQIDGSFGQGRFKNVNKAWLRVYRSSGIFVGANAENLVEAKQRTAEPYGAPPALKSEEIPVLLTPSWCDSGQVFVRQSDPLPLTVVSLTAEIAMGG